MSYLEKSRLENPEALLQAIEHALLLPRDNESCHEAFLPNASKPVKRFARNRKRGSSCDPALPQGPEIAQASESIWPRIEKLDDYEG